MKSIFSFAALTTLTLTLACSSSQKVEDAPMEAAEEMAEPAAEAVEEAVEATTEAALPELTVDAVDALIQQEAAKVVVYDANGKDTRMSKGTLPGAVLLTSYSDYDTSILPEAKDTKLVFYCGSTQCTASDKAAVRAKAAGYSDVCVMRAGIKGWIEAGKETAKVEAAAEPNQG